MAKMGCFCALLGGNRKKSKDVKKVSYPKRANGNDWQKVKPVESMDGTDAAPPIVRKGSSVDSAPARDTKVVAQTAAELARRGLEDNGGKASTARALHNDVDLVGGTATGSSGCSTAGADNDAISAAAPDDLIVPAGAASRALPNSPSRRLQRSCSNIETASSGWKAFDDMLPPAKSRSHDDLVALPASSLFTSPNVNAEPGGTSPEASVKTTYSADRVMLKRRSSSQVLPSRSRKLWWSMFLWSHRNLHRPGASMSTLLPPTDTNDDDDDVCHSHQRHDGYTSENVDAKKNKEIAAVEEEPATIQSQWVAFSAEGSSSLDRVSAWVSSSLIHAGEEEDGIVEVGESSGTKGHVVQAPARRRSPAKNDAVQASTIVQTLNAFSTVAHVSGMGLKIVPIISAFSSLRAVNLSSNLIAHIAPGSLPKGLHTLDLSRNNIATIEGLRELTRLRVLSLSYNRISRIGHGLSSCTAIRELYLAGNKISDVEGLHRLLKLAVLDVSFNRITTAKGLGQLVANYNSLRALNILGNPVQANVGDDTLRKAVSGLLPRLEYLNKQALKPQRAREAAKDSVAKAALGNSRWSSRRRASSRRSSLSPGSSSKRAGSSRSRSKSNMVQNSSLTRR